ADSARGLVFINQAFQTAPEEDAAMQGALHRVLGAWGPYCSPLEALVKDSGSSVSAGAFLPDGRRIILCSYDGRVRLWDLQTGEALAWEVGHDALVRSVAAAPDGLTVITGSGDRTARLWDARTGEQKLLLPHDAGVTFVSYISNGRLLTASQDGR